MKKNVRYLLVFLFISVLAYGYFVQTKLFFFRMVSFGGLCGFYMNLLFCLNKYLKAPKKIFDKSLIFYLLIVLFILTYSVVFDSTLLITLFFHPYAFPAFILPVILLFNSKMMFKEVYSLSRWIFYLSPLFVGLDLLVFNQPVFIVITYSALLFCFIFSKKKGERLLLLAYLLATIYLLLKIDHRSGVIIIFTFLILFYSRNVLFFITNKRIRILLLISVFIFIALFFFNYTEFYEYFTRNINVTSINTVDTRSFLYLELFEGFKTSEYLFGRGYLGTYYSQYFKDWSLEGGDSFNRFTIEVGFLECLLKGGLLLLTSTILLITRSIYFGFVKSNFKSWQFMVAFWLLLEFGMMTIENVPSFNLHFLYIWVLVTILIPSRINMENKTIYAP